VRALEKVIHSLPASKGAKDLAKSPSNVASLCVPEKNVHTHTYTSYIPVLECKYIKS
jgi:hypothetical protein